MAQQITIPENITAARENASALAGVAGDYSAKSYSIEDELKKVVQEALDYNKDVIDMRSSAMADYFAAPAAAESRYGTKTFETGDQAGQANKNYIFNPFERNAVIADYVKNEEVPFLTSNTLLGMREGTVADTVKAGTNAFQAKVAAAAAEAKAANDAYANLLSEFTQTEQLQQGRESLDIQRTNAGRGSSVAPADQNAQLVASLQSVQQRAAKIVADKGYITQEEMQQLWATETPLLQNLGIDAGTINQYINTTLSADEVVAQAPPTAGQKIAASPIGQFVSKNPSPTVYAGNAIKDFIGTNVQRGASVVQNLLNKFK